MSQQNWFGAWCAAESAATRAIRIAARESLLVLQREGELRADAKARELRRLRDEANALFQQAMSAMRAPARPAGPELKDQLGEF